MLSMNRHPYLLWFCPEKHNCLFCNCYQVIAYLSICLFIYNLELTEFYDVIFIFFPLKTLKFIELN